MRRFTIVAIGSILLIAAGDLRSQEATSTETKVQNYVKLLRKDIKKDKVAILTELMDMTPEEAAKFWPLYNKYDKELTVLGDERVALMRNFIANYGSMPDDKVAEIGYKALDQEGRVTELKKRYFAQMLATVSAKKAGRFLQIENQLLMIIDLQTASLLPMVQ